MVCWGFNQFGQTVPPPSVDGTAGTAFAVSAGWDHSCAIQSGTGQVICWGDSRFGKTAPAGLDGLVAGAIAAGTTHTLAIALPEPEQVVALLAGCALLAVLARRRRA